MENRQLLAARSFLRLIIIMIGCLLFVACTTPPPAQISDRDQPPTRRIQGAAPATPQQVPIPASGEHLVARGDTLYSIAWRYGLDYRELARRNAINAPYVIHPNQRLRLDAAAPNRPVASPSPAPARPTAPPVARSENRTPAPAVRAPAAASGGAINWRWPANGRILVAFNGNNGLNKGIDIDGNLGQPVIAAAAGQVVYAGSGLRGYGNLLIIKHNDTYLSAYAHNQRLLVQEGEEVKAGQRVADMGSSGADRVKLHFEIRRNGTPVDPMGYLPRR